MSIKTTAATRTPTAPKATRATTGRAQSASTTAKAQTKPWAPGKTTKTTGWTPKDSPKRLAGEFTAQGDGLKSVRFSANNTIELETSDGSRSSAQFAIGRGAALFMDTLAVKSGGAMRLFGVSSVERDTSGKIVQLHLSEFINGSPTDIEPVLLTRK